MILVVCATELELEPFLERVPPDGKQWRSLVSGVGVVETTLALSRFFEKQDGRFDAVLHFGVAGAYLGGTKSDVGLLDICLADQEIFADFGICHETHFESLPKHLVRKSSYTLDAMLLDRCKNILQRNKVAFKQGSFATVFGVSATEKRGRMLAAQYGALCENMEGAAVARVCEEFSVPLVELRSISNFVEDRNLSGWKLGEACEQAAEVAAILLQELVKK